MRNHEVTKVQPLLNSSGSLTEPGWSKRLLQVYDRNAIKAPKFRIKEWDYYLVISEKNNFGVALTLSDDGYIGLQSATLLDFSIPWEHTETILNPFPMGRFKLPSTSGGATRFITTNALTWNLSYPRENDVWFVISKISMTGSLFRAI